MELDKIKEIIELLRDTDITDLQIEEEGIKVRLRRERYLTSIEMPRMPAPKEKPPGGSPLPAEEETQRVITVTAPLVGTFYRSPSPDAAPFVEVGSRVKKGQVICIIEAMKLMNEIESEVDGVVVKPLVDNGQPVEYGEPLFLLEPV